MHAIRFRVSEGPNAAFHSFLVEVASGACRIAIWRLGLDVLLDVRK